MTLRTFDTAGLIITYGGDQISGWVDGEYLTIAYDDEFFKFSNGADGEVGRVKNNKRMATATVKLLQTSASNDVLSGYLLEDLDNNAPQVFLAKDLNGNTIFDGSDTTIVKFADVSYGVDMAAREWTLKIGTLIGFVGGNFVN